MFLRQNASKITVMQMCIKKNIPDRFKPLTLAS